MKVTLLGDSIRQQYGPKVKELLGEDFEVWAPEDNCRFVKYTLRGLFDWAPSMEGSQIVHWNNGLWDLCNLYGDGIFTNDEEFINNVLRIADLLKQRYGTVIFATITPVRSTNVYNKNDDADRLNKKIVPLLQERGIIINDLNALLRSDPDRYICDDTIHLSEEAIEICAAQVADIIKNAAKNISISSNNTQNTDKVLRDSTGAPVLL